MGKNIRSLRVCALALLLVTAPLMAAPIGTVVKTFNVDVTRMVADPVGPYVFGSVPSQNAVAIFNTDTMTMVGTVFVGSNPAGLAVSPDGTRLYSANSGANSVGVVNLQSMTALPSLPVSVQPTDIQAGNNNQLYLLGNGVIQQVSAVTGNNSAPSQGAWDGEIKIDANRNTLIFGNTGLSPGHFNKYDLSSGQITGTGGFDFGGNCRCVDLASDGSFFTYASAGSPYQIPVRATGNFATLGTLNLGGPPELITLSPDNKYAYVRTTFVDPILVFNLQTFLQETSFTGPEPARDLVTDASGQYLFVSSAGAVTVYDTGRIAPEPGSAMIGLLGGVLLGGRGQRRRRRCTGTRHI